MSPVRVRNTPSLSSRWFLFVVLVAVVAKMWLMSEFRIVAAYAPHDASNFLEHARTIDVGHWFGAYNDLTLIKQPFYPMYLALVEQLGLTLNVANIILDALAALVACYAVRPLIASWKALAVTFIVLFFNPYSFDNLERVLYRSHINPDLALLTVATLFGVFVRRRCPISTSLPWFVGFGVSFAAFWLTREEAIWLVPSLGVIFACYVLWVLAFARPELRRRLGTFVIPAAILAFSIGSIMYVNYRVYGWAVTNEQQAPEFVSAYNSLTRIVVHKVRYIPLPRAARMIAYSVSPAARELKPSLDGPNGAGWTATTCGAMPGLCAEHDIGAGWTEWAVRDATQNAGHYVSGSNAREFYVRLAHEIDVACDTGRIACTTKSRSVFPPPIHPADIPDILANFVVGYQIFLGQSVWGYGVPGAPPVTTSMRLDYDFIVRGVYNPGNYHRFLGWLVYDQAKPPIVQGPGSTDAQITFSASPDIAAALAATKGFSPSNEQSARFEVTSSCDEACLLVVPRKNGGPVSIPLTADTTDVRVPGLLYHLDLSRKVDEFDAPLKDGILLEVGRTYQSLFWIGAAGCFLLALIRAVRAIICRRTGRVYDHVVLTFSVFSSVSILMVLLAVINVLAFTGAYNEEYMGAMNPLVLLAASVTIALELSVAARFLRRYLPRLSRHA